MLLRVEGASYDDLMEALSLLSDATVTLLPEAVAVPDNWKKLPTTDSQRQAFLLAFYQSGAMTREEAKEHALVGVSSNYGGDQTRVSELIAGGWLYETGEKRRGPSGDLAAVVDITDKAKGEIHRAPKGWFPGGKRLTPAV